MPVQTEAHDLRRVVTEALQPLEALLADRQLQFERMEEPVPALADPNLMRRVVTNLVGNAISFTSPRTGRIHIRLGQDGGRARMEVADNGPGIDPDYHEAIFEKFAQADDKVRDQSSGLGLAFCKLAIEAQQGRIGVESQLGAGSRFWFEVPAATSDDVSTYPQRS
jgi:signal transduction histidine kinase